MTILAVIGVQALYLLFVWLAAAIIASLLSGEKGYGERIGLASGLLLSPLGPLLWLIMPPKAESDWKVRGPSPAGRACMALMAVVGLGALGYGVYLLVSDDDASMGAIIALLVYGAATLAASVVAFATAPARAQTPEPLAR